MALAEIILEPHPQGIKRLPKDHPEYALFHQLWSNWFSDEPLLPFFTSGSTGNPKAISFSRKQVAASARLTQAWLDPKNEKNWLLCLPLGFVAGRMVLYRSLLSKTALQVMPPRSQPIQSQISAKLVSLTPSMLHAALQIPEARVQLLALQGILLGGGPVSIELQQAIQNWGPNHTQVWHTYGMTETLTHVGARPLHPNPEEAFRPIAPDIKWEMTDLGLRINHPALQEAPIQTGDAGEIAEDGSFRWTGRMDSMLKVGGQKVWPEQLEQRLLEEFGKALPPFYFSGTSDPVYGQRLVLVLERLPENWQQVQALLNTWSGPYRPGYWAIRPQDFNAETGKIRRSSLAVRQGLCAWNVD
jgi:O-succinylbenzoic acid--CoA ligase